MTEMIDRDRDGIYETAVPDDQTRTPPHGDMLVKTEPILDVNGRIIGRRLLEDVTPAAVDRQMQELASAISRRTPVSPFPIYRALLHHSAEEVEAAIDAASAAGVDASSFPVYLVAAQIPGLTTEEVDAALRSPPILPALFPGVTVTDAMENAAAFARALQADTEPNPLPRRLPAHIERAARAAYAVGYDDCLRGEGHREDRGPDAFRASLEHDADAAQRAT